MKSIVNAPTTGSTISTTAASRNQSKSTKGCVNHKNKGISTPPPSPPSRNTSDSKKQWKRERQLQKEQQHRFNRSMLWMILTFYIILVSMIFILCMITQPKQFHKIWSQASLAIQNPNMKQDTMIASGTYNAKKDSTSSNRYKRYQQHHEEDFVEVGIGQRPTVNAATATRAEPVTTQAAADASISTVVEGTQILTTAVIASPSFSFQKGDIFGVDYIQCCTIHGSGGTPSHYVMDEHGIPIADIQMPISYSSNDIVLLGRRFFRNHLVSRELKHGGEIPIETADVEHRAFYEYCVTAEQHDGYIDSIIVLDLDHTTSTLHVTNLMKELLRIRRISALPVATIVTPEQSSQTILDWIMYGDQHILTQNIARHWIPISAGPYILQTISDDQSSDEYYVESTVDSYSKNNSTTATDRIGSSMSIPSSSIFRQIDQWPILTISGMDDTISQAAAETLRHDHHLYTNHSVVPGNTSCYILSPSIIIVAMIDYFQDWERRHPRNEGSVENNHYDHLQLLDADERPFNRHGSDPIVSNIFPA